MLTSTILVLAMILPGLALFYGGLVRSKNMLSVLSQVLGITSVAILVWVGWGYSLAFDAGSAFIGGPSKFFLAGIDGDSAARSEEHTSELQSLMRIPYAVFCLKKKKCSIRKQKKT